jgi:hypothetical protein
MLLNLDFPKALTGFMLSTQLEALRGCLWSASDSTEVDDIRNSTSLVGERSHERWLAKLRGRDECRA